MSNSSLESSLRIKRNGIWSRCADSAKNNSQDSIQICHDWSTAADELLTEAFKHCFPENDIALFALGKLGSEELNLSSDVDVLFVSDADNDKHLRGLRQFQKLLSERTAEGFVFRVDFDLRPGGRHGPLIPTVEHFRDYYGNYGETWERLAFVRLRAITGNPEIIRQVEAFAKKFSFRRHLDFTLFDDLKHLRGKIQNAYHTPANADVIDLKMGIGGIRDLELFCHALLVVHGGKDPSLQTRGTIEALKLLSAKAILPQDESDFLVAHYRNLRGLENYVQALNDEQTHLLRLNDTHPEFVTTALKTLSSEMQNCDQIVKTLLGESPKAVSLENELSTLGLPEDDIKELWNEIIEQEVLSRNKGRDETARKSFLQEFVNILQAQGGDSRRALSFLKDFIRSTRAKASFFTLLLRENELLKKLAWLFAHSPYLSRILCSRPELLDSFVFRAQNELSEDLDRLLEELAEKKLLSELINGSQYLEDRDLDTLLQNLTFTADSIASALLTALKKDYPCSVEILALGKWGGKELGFKSDLDFLFVITGEPSDNDFKLAKRFISRMTESHRGGNIYSIDMRLRPSGKAGPIVIPLSDLQSYLTNESEIWERQAYLKSRWVNFAGPSLVDCYIDQGLTAAQLLELNRIRQELVSKSPTLNLKYSEGGMVDIELAIQTVLLNKRLAPPNSSTEGFLSVESAQHSSLAKNYTYMRQIEQMLQLIASESTAEVSLNHESFHGLAVAFNTSPSKLLEDISERISENLITLKALDPRRGHH
ncbi:glutamine-synthetase adenylyltransferase [Bdellovibrio sp. ZAP7]|uniref:[protein-PII] uridylyltransferase family protein n=1 Tax=Bdellovibrio sp. ZAP7 TaxID=2231053 RepID=UPI0011580165|nr:glutamine-synthetase adenylyltransferase [Bdellovibrio sp. ZAP7]QDK43805.1 glutamine-synthetase adenylyltransferase [Bdellovibrio sp. ZAP7]